MSDRFDTILDAIAERVAQRLRADLSQNSNTAPIKPRLLTVEQAAAYLGRSANSMRHLIAAGKISSVKFDNRVFLDILDLDRAIESAKHLEE